MTDGSDRSGTPLRVVVADDQAAVREGLILLLDGLPDIDVVGSAADGEQALALVAEHRPDAVLLDLHMPVLDGLDTTRRLAAEHPQLPDKGRRSPAHREDAAGRGRGAHRLRPAGPLHAPRRHGIAS
jgi:CheY-like chemotaxis protein